MPTEEQILRILSYTGPSVGSQLAAKINEDSLLTSAFLADLVRRGKIKLSKFKTASSPFYYLEGQEDMLIQMTIKEMNHKDRPTIIRLQENFVLRDDEMTLLERVSIRKYPDLAMPMQVTIEGTPILYWRWFQVEPAHFTKIIEDMFYVPEPVQEEIPEDLSNPVEEKVPEVVEEKVPEVVEEEKIPAPVQETIVEAVATVDDTQQSLVEPVTLVTPKPKKGDELLPATITHLENIGCIIQRSDSVKKNREHNLKILVPTHFGNIPYFVKVRNKKRCDEKDISAAYMEAEVQRLPLLFLYTGDISDKAQKIADSDRFESLLTGRLPWD